MKQMKCILLSLICAAILEILTVVSLGVYWHILRNGIDETEWCSSLKIKDNGNPDLLGQLIVKTDKNTDRNKACGRLSTMLETVVAHKIHRSYDSDTNPEYLKLNFYGFGCTVSERTVSTLKLYNIASHATPDPVKQTKVNWHAKHGTENDLKAVLEEGVIYIKRAGYYYVSSLLTLRAQNITTTDTDKRFPDVMSHAVYVIHHKDRFDRLLLANVKSLCQMAFENAKWSSNLGAVFYLNEHDKVYVAISHPYNIVTGHSNDYISIHTIF